MTTKPALTLRLAAPRGFCAGVDRAIQIVEEALKKWGAPVYVRHEIVHNRHVVERLEALGAIFVEELEECPDDRPFFPDAGQGCRGRVCWRCRHGCIPHRERKG